MCLPELVPEPLARLRAQPKAGKERRMFILESNGLDMAGVDLGGRDRGGRFLRWRIWEWRLVNMGLVLRGGNSIGDLYAGGMDGWFDWFG